MTASSGKTSTETMAVSAPTYVLEESISSQKLWRKTAGNRPPQPVEERAYFEEIWAHNFLQSQVNYHAPLEVLVASSPISMSPYADVGFGDSNDVGNNYITVGHYHNPTVFGGAGGDLKRANKYVEVAAAEASLAQRSMCNNNINSANKKIQSSGEGTLSVLIKGDNIFGTTVSKSFARADRSGRIDTISISIASYRVVQVSRRSCLNLYFSTILILAVFLKLVKKVWQVCTISCGLSRRKFSKHCGSMEALF